ncbi:NAD(P)-dependent oxidoreductase [Sphingomicrobium clamense]|uniref:NAD(P)-dependent oxidoreductase n=1 Tax=Sphingomicrobium clamense TaxID=2851013 RepID=A0ABS6V4F3_9SPHN|nr:NAD(P)-dependent oxidoreductase [Sphingomicrobium sp. B8]
MTRKVGLVGVGTLGDPVARHLVAAGHDLTLYNRTRAKAEAVEGARVADDAASLIAECDVIFLVLATEEQSDEVLGSASDLSGKTIVQLATTSPDYSEGLQTRISEAAGVYVEAPISGSRVPAERGELVAMLAGEPQAKASVRDLFEPFTAKLIDCGAVPKGIAMKLASNVMLGPLMLGIVESMAFAKRAGLDLETFGALLKNSQMASPILGVKVDKILSGDWSPQAQMDNVITSGGDAVKLAHRLGMEGTLLEHALVHVEKACAAGLDKEDVAAVFKLLADEPKA